MRSDPKVLSNTLRCALLICTVLIVTGTGMNRADS
jgi:hypothetical protein